MKPSLKPALVALCFGVLPFASSSHAALLLLDEFNTGAASDDVNSDINGSGRQTGSQAGTLYRQGYGTFGTISGTTANEAGNGWQTQVNNGGTTNNLWLVGQGGAEIASVSPEHNFVEIPGSGEYFSVSFDLNPSGGGWGGITIGASDNASFGAAGTGARGQFINDAAAHFGFLLGENGTWEAFDGNTQIDTDGAGTITDFATIEVRVTGLTDSNPWDGVNDAFIEVFLDGSSLTTYTKTGGYTDNYVTLLGFGTGFDIHQFDNLTVQTIPEPSPAILIGGLGIMLLVRRGRARD